MYDLSQVTRVTWQVLLAEQELFTLMEHQCLDVSALLNLKFSV